jgi:hypothetical protein
MKETIVEKKVVKKHTITVNGKTYNVDGDLPEDIQKIVNKLHPDAVERKTKKKFKVSLRRNHEEKDANKPIGIKDPEYSMKIAVILMILAAFGYLAYQAYHVYLRFF